MAGQTNEFSFSNIEMDAFLSFLQQKRDDFLKIQEENGHSDLIVKELNNIVSPQNLGKTLGLIPLGTAIWIEVPFAGRREANLTLNEFTNGKKLKVPSLTRLSQGIGSQWAVHNLESPGEVLSTKTICYRRQDGKFSFSGRTEINEVDNVYPHKVVIKLANEVQTDCWNYNKTTTGWELVERKNLVPWLLKEYAKENPWFDVEKTVNVVRSVIGKEQGDTNPWDFPDPEFYVSGGGVFCVAANREVYRVWLCTPWDPALKVGQRAGAAGIMTKNNPVQKAFRNVYNNSLDFSVKTGFNPKVCARGVEKTLLGDRGDR